MAAIHMRESSEYFKGLDSQISTALYKERLLSGNIKFVIGVITVKRKYKKSSHSKSPSYLLHSMALIDKTVKWSKYFDSSVPFICNVDLNPNDHKDALNLYAYLPYSERYGNNSFNAPLLTLPNSDSTFKSWTKHASKYNKETVDYSFCLRTAAYLKPNFVILIEDDTIPHIDFPTILEHMIESRLKSLPKYAYLKLYFPPKWQGFAAELSTIFDLALWASIMACIVSLCLLLLSKCGLRFSHDVLMIDFSKYYLSLQCISKIPLKNKAFISLYLVCLITIWLLGRQNVEALRRLWRYFYRLEQANGCCTQAQLYPIDVVEALSEYLLSVPVTTHTDLAISDFAAERDLPAWQVEPNLFFHNGLITSLNGGQKHPEEFMFGL
ncbi:hypothetical protein RRG08_018597 [Elysia crispata]|uniref:Uncharacterized protein n=1 Tax=Elysia crispata TaxID=231223 RepID=A0AAE1DY70_9GAST|nr:hypothetical protein RRG08_018597 [Elysia crispata]